jgi:hypothetical protein
MGELLMPANLQPLGAMTALLAIWLMFCGVRNDFLFVLFPVAILLLGIGIVME